jgi:hypothetical protein
MIEWKSRKRSADRSIIRRALAGLSVAALVLIAAFAIAAPPAPAAGLEVVQHFSPLSIPNPAPEDWSEFPEDTQMAGVSDMAINRTGAGGVSPGTLYAIGSSATAWTVSRFSPKGDFELRWQRTSRCGPKAGGTQCSPSANASYRAFGIDINQATGDVYVFAIEGAPNVVRVYKADGTGPIVEFGGVETSWFGPESTISSSPTRFHGTYPGGNLAVNDEGIVYLGDVDSNFDSRLMIFKPVVPGVFTNYEYTGELLHRTYGEPEPANPILDDAGNIYTATEDTIQKSSPNGVPLCEFAEPKNAMSAMTINPVTGGVFYYQYKPNDRQIHQLAPCDEGQFQPVPGGAVSPVPVRAEIKGMVVNPALNWDPDRPAGVLYAGAPESCPQVGNCPDGGAQSSLGYILAPPVSHLPVIEAQSVTRVGSNGATLNADINPKGTQTTYAFQYLTEVGYQENGPDELQALTVAAAGGLFGLGFEGRRFGGAALGSFSAGSNSVASLKAATATASLSAAQGVGDLNGAKGTGTIVANSITVSSVLTEAGTFEGGQSISGEGIPVGTTIVEVLPESGRQRLTLSKPATKTAVERSFTAGSNKITALTTSEGAFAPGQVISGVRIPAGTTIVSRSLGELTLSNSVTGPEAAVALKAGSTTLTSLVSEFGAFEAGAPIEGEGIPATATVTAASPGQLTISKPVTKPGTSVPVSDPGPYPLAVGETLQGPGIAPGTTILADDQGQLTLSQPATASGTGVLLHAGLPFDATATELRHALEALSTISSKGVSVAGGPGEQSGSAPYEITFMGKHENTEVDQLVPADISLTGSPANASVQTLHDGGQGFSQGTTEAPLGGAQLGSAQTALPASVVLSGLAPDTGYRFRVIATSAEGADDGPAQAFRTFSLEASGLPDNRAWELVSPAQKNGGQVIPANPTIASCADCKPGTIADRFPMQSSEDGDSVVYQGFPFSFTEGAAVFNQYLSTRTTSGWQTTNLSPALMGNGSNRGYKAFDPELDQGLLSQFDPVLSPEAPDGFADLYAQPTASPESLTPLLLSDPPNRLPEGQGPESFDLAYAGASADLSRVFLLANDALTPETSFAPAAEDGGPSKYDLYEWAAGQLRLVNVLPGNTVSAAGGPIFPGPSSHAISADGSRAFWSDESGQVYVRENGESTTAIPDPGKFLTASADGSRVLLADGHLYDLETKVLTDLTEGQGGFQGLAGHSDDLSHVYFVATAVLDETSNELGATAQAGKPNLYDWHGVAARYVVTMLPTDTETWNASPADRSAEASSDGRWLAFLSTGSLTGYDNRGTCGGGSRLIDCTEVFLFDSNTGSLLCASCSPSGQAPVGPSVLRLVQSSPSYLPQPHYLSNSGRLIFDSADSLSPFDTNDRVEDIYQYEPEGIGNCLRQAGCVSLISAGREPVDSNFLTMDPSGKNVFFTTRDQLVLKDKDELIDVYVAREDGGIAAETEVPRGGCQGEACLPQTGTPNRLVPSSASGARPGNINEPTHKACPKDKVRKKGKCVKKQGHKKRHSKKRANSNRGGSR